MQIRQTAAVVSTLFGFVISMFALAAHIPLSTKCKESDLIAIVEISKTRKGDASKPYRKVADARVVEIIKGRIDGTNFFLDFDNGLACPNVTYETGEKCLVFLSKLKSGHFETYNDYFGAFRITNDIVTNWEFKADTQVDAVRKEILTSLK